MNIFERQNKVIEMTRRRVDEVIKGIEEARELGMRPSQEELRRRFDEAAMAQDPAKLDVFKAMYGDDEFYRQWSLYLKRQGGQDGEA